MEELHGESPTGVGGQGPGVGETSPGPCVLSPEDEATDTQDSALSTQDRSTQNSEPDTDPQSPAPDPQVEIQRLRGEVEETRSQWLGAHRRALLAESAGRVVPELVAGDSIEALEASVEVARRAFEAAKVAALEEVASTRVPAGNPVRQGPDVEGLSPMEKIAHGLKRSNE